jgi:glycosyltransferase involved in cell wall biosynthesis
LASASRPQFLPGGPFLLTIGNFLPHKNFHVLLDLIASVPEKRLVIAGKKATAYGNFVEREVSRRGLQNRVVMPGELSDGDRQWLYEECDAFLFPSLTEGFGFPVLEAMQCGKPVFMSRKTSLPEIAGDCGYFFESYDAPAMTTTYRQGMEHWAADPTLPSRCRRHAESFSWQASAERYATIYESVLAANATPPRA